jgi:Acyl CoA binding protein
MAEADFEKAAADVKALTKRPADAELLELYGLFKQVCVLPKFLPPLHSGVFFAVAARLFR